MELKSSAYRAGSAIPARYSCDGDNISPAMAWKGAPARTKSFALILHDPDAPSRGGFTHWVIYNMDAKLNQLVENIPRQANVARLGMQGKNDAGQIGYMGPCPPSGTHRYVARLFALDTMLRLKPGATQKELEAAMRGHILETATLIGTYARIAATHS
ncbi:MAG TPA: YbhB/YbcL family Raf kinase inhibitor-like protein [Acidobacteriaceae bacterium]|nr:YbhB/YbcL family Raf kinase inhibitor-like protein [Acidobacteriaceae bacterium]